MKTLLVLTLACLSSVSVFGQQYEGETIPNTLPNASIGGEKAYFNIFDSLGGRTTLINHFSFPNGARQNKTQVQRAIVILHGANRDCHNYFSELVNSLNGASLIDPTVNQNTVAIISPCFKNTADAGTGYPVTGGVSTTSVLAWNGTGWYEGRDNVYPAAQATVSSYDVLDQILLYFDNILEYPNLKQIVVAGHSMGAQMVLRYAAVGKILSLRTPVNYWSGNPSSFVWFASSRPSSTATCPDYDAWGQGFGDYDINYELAFVQLEGRAGVKARYDSRRIGYARGLSDFGDYSDGKCGPFTQGTNRGTRMYNFYAAFPPTTGLFDSDTVDYYPSVTHNSVLMMQQTPGVYRLFFDNWSGNGSRHADFGPRQVAGDDPFPTSVL